MKKKKLCILLLALVLVTVSFGAAEAAGSSAKKVSAKQIPAKTVIKDVWGSVVGSHTVTVEWKGVKGASDYQVQYRYTKNGKKSDWKNKVRSIDGEWRPFFTYQKMVKSIKKEYPDGIVEIVQRKNGKKVLSTVPVDAYIDSMTLKKNQATVSWLPQDDRTYEFRVRAYRTENGKKVCGAWSSAFPLKERLDTALAYQKLVKFAKAYAEKNHPEWKYIDENGGMNDSAGSYYTYGVLGASSRYVRTEDFVQEYKKRIASYIRTVKGADGQDAGTLYIKRVRPGDSEGFQTNQSDETYYKVWMLF